MGGGERVRYLVRGSPSGGRPAVARNEGMKLARGEFVHFLDDDDLLFDGALAALRSPLLARSEAGVSFGLVEPFGEDADAVAKEQAHFEEATRTARESRDSRWRIARAVLFGTTPIICSSCLFRRTDALGVGGFDPTIVVYEDLDFFVRVARTHGAAFVDRPVLRRRTGQAALSRDARREDVLGSFARMYESYRQRFGAAEFYALKLTARLRVRRPR